MYPDYNAKVSTLMDINTMETKFVLANKFDACLTIVIQKACRQAVPYKN